MSHPSILVINAGSSSIKFTLFEKTAKGDLPLIGKGAIEGINADVCTFVGKDAKGTVLLEQSWNEKRDHAASLSFLLPWIEKTFEGYEMVAAGHRVVHGGTQYAEPVKITPQVIEYLEGLIPLAPLHEPHNLAAIKAVAQMHPSLPQVACFDTAFHHTHMPLADRFGLPRALHDEGVHRYGFHGLSYEFVSRSLPAVSPRLAQGKVVVAHLGNGSSMCAMDQGRSIDSTMGFTAVEGLMMGTRTGSLDPGVVLYLLQNKKMDAKAIETLLYKQSGLLGVSGISSDMRTLLESKDPRAAEAIDLFTFFINRHMGALMAVLGGLDGLAFTAGIGERGTFIRAKVASLIAPWTGLKLDVAANEEASRSGQPTRISAPDSRLECWVIPTNEELMIARHTVGILK
ncbi:MAG: acetate/propionate family kinase [Alphaproteobacteria bacterium]|nr:MAG: acetate/propionate family kinase [Alphaproteobacteria bacterium]